MWLWGPGGGTLLDTCAARAVGVHGLTETTRDPPRVGATPEEALGEGLDVAVLAVAPVQAEVTPEGR